MSIDISQCVRSKYFASETAMDESLSDFQETKLNCKGPKAVQKAPKTKSRKVTKRIKGQKDIRTALKGKKNELISYTKEFDSVCRKSGLNVDSEELHLAIALSKSLQSDTPEDASASQLSTQSRIAKIRTTLQEYGFKVPQTKITSTNKRIKKHRKDYKLFNATEEEKHQRITSKYSQVLFENLDCTKSVENTCTSSDETPVYNIATNLEYECMRDNNIFYVNNLVERSITKGSLLRDWSEIPGRPVSPILFDKGTMDFSEIICSQDELDIILSGPIKSANNIVANKKTKNLKQIDCSSPQVLVVDDNENNTEVTFAPKENDVNDDNSIIIEDVIKQTIVKIGRETKCEVIPVTETDCNHSLLVKEQYRSCSPDIFDDEESCILETSKPFLSQGQKTKVFTEETNDMDLTECVNKVLSQNVERTQFISQNITKIKPDDFMDITECAVSASQGIQININAIDLTQSPEEIFLHLSNNQFNDDIDNDLNYVPENPEHSFLQEDISDRESGTETIIDAINPTHNSIGGGNKSIISNENKCINLESEIVTEDNLNIYEAPRSEVDLTQSSNEDENRVTVPQSDKKAQQKEIDLMDLTQSSKSSVDIDDLPEINVCYTQKSQPNLDDTIILNEEEYIGTDGKFIKPKFVQDDEIFDLTQADDESLVQSNSNTKTRDSKINSQSFYEDFIHDHSDSKENVDNIEVCDDVNSAHNTSKESNEIDLTQSSDGSGRNRRSSMLVTAIENVPNNSSLGKKDDISIDYDEINEYVSYKEDTKKSNCIDTDKDTLSFKYDSSKSQVHSEIVDINHDLVSNSSKNSEVFDLTDKELDYSMHKSRFDVPIDNYNFEFEVNDISNEESSIKSTDVRNSITNKEYVQDESFLPEVNIKKAEEKYIESTDKQNAVSVNKVHDIEHSSEDKIPVVTPKNSEYIIKTDGVTPMLDYASMTTPQRNRELDKYGLKPFKRKRAIQILTHIYNQTHPVIEDEELSQPSPSKKPRHNDPVHSSLHILQSPRKPEEITRRINPAQKETILNSISPKKSEEINRRINSPRKEIVRNSKSPRKVSENDRNLNSPRKDGNSSKECLLNSYELTSEIPSIKNIDCDPDDWVFQKREKAKVHSCRVPLHVAFHNYVSSRRGLREAILQYEPVNIDVIHKDLVSYGHRYDPKDLLRFLDKKCITVKTTDNNARNKR